MVKSFDFASERDRLVIKKAKSNWDNAKGFKQ